MLLGTRQLGAAWHPHDWHLEVSRDQPGGGLDTSNILCLLHLLCFSVTGCLSRLGMTFQSLWQLPLWSTPARHTGIFNIISNKIVPLLLFTGQNVAGLCQTSSWRLGCPERCKQCGRTFSSFHLTIKPSAIFAFFNFFTGRAGSDSDCQNNGGENCQCCER